MSITFTLDTLPKRTKTLLGELLSAAEAYGWAVDQAPSPKAVKKAEDAYAAAYIAFVFHLNRKGINK